MEGSRNRTPLQEWTRDFGEFLSDSEVDFPRIATKNGARVWAED